MDKNVSKSIALLEKYKHEITKEQFDKNLSIIGTFAIESMYLDEEDIIDLIRIDKGENPDDLIKEIKMRNARNG